MKLLFVVLTLMVLPVGNTHADEPSGIRFFSGSWPNLLLEARRYNKPVYVDFYTDWCPPCRRMAREAFPNTAVGAKFNPNFISYQVNAEVGEGVDVARRFGVISFPTALYLLPTGEVVHRGVGYGGVNAMLQQADMVLRMPAVRKIRRSRTRPLDVPAPIPTLPLDSLRATG